MSLKSITNAYKKYIMALLYTNDRVCIDLENMKLTSKGIVDLIIGYVLPEVSSKPAEAPVGTTSAKNEYNPMLSSACFKMACNGVVVNIEFIESRDLNKSWRLIKCTVGSKDVTIAMNRMIRDICLSDAYPKSAPPTLIRSQ